MQLRREGQGSTVQEGSVEATVEGTVEGTLEGTVK